MVQYYTINYYYGLQIKTSLQQNAQYTTINYFFIDHGRLVIGQYFILKTKLLYNIKCILLIFIIIYIKQYHYIPIMLQFIIVHRKTAAGNYIIFYPKDRMLFSIFLLRIEIVCAEFYLQDRTYSILRIEIFQYALVDYSGLLCVQNHPD